MPKAIRIDTYKYVRNSIDEMIYVDTIYLNTDHIIKITPSSILGGLYCKITVTGKSNNFFAKMETRDAHALFFGNS